MRPDRLANVRALPLLLALALLGGCVGKERAAEVMPESLAQLSGPSDDELARTPGSLHGLVRTAALEPVPNATVEDGRLSLTTTTDAAGTFVLDGLTTGEHLLSISAFGYLTHSVKVQTQNGTALAIEIVIERMASAEPYVETRELAGFLSCAALVGEERHDCASADPNHRDVFEFDLAGSGKNVVLELVWDPADTPGASRMTLFAETVGYGAQDIGLGNATGAGYARVEVPSSVMEKYYPEGGVMRAFVVLAPGEAPVSATAQTSFTVFVTTFYHEAGPAGFSVAG